MQIVRACKTHIITKMMLLYQELEELVRSKSVLLLHKCDNSGFSFWSELELIKLVKGKSDHQHNCRLLTSSDGVKSNLREVTAGDYK